MTFEFNNAKAFQEEYKRRMIEHYGRSIVEAHPTEKYIILGEMIRDYASVNWMNTKDGVSANEDKQMFYFSMEFLLGRLLTNNLMNMGIYETVKEGLAGLNIDINELEELESDPGLGNGGLGRLAACFLDSLASLNLAGNGNCIRYEYGLFKQKIEHGEQIEVPDQWMDLGNVWEVRKSKHAVKVKFGGHVEMWMNENGKTVVHHVPSLVVRAIPYDMPVIGYNTKLTNTLRLWSAEVEGDTCDASSLNQYVNEVREICSNVYPDDSNEHGKKLRLKQQYFFVAAGLSNIVEAHFKKYGTLDNFADKNAIQLNDTHPVLCIPELLRILMDEYGYEWDPAWSITQNSIAYTNHTVLAEALEKWPTQYIKELLPRIFMIIEEIDHRFSFFLSHHATCAKYAQKCAIVKEGQVHMAHMAIVGSHSVNGVAALHTHILKTEVMKEFYAIFPEKFSNKTNGITHRRWLLYSNPQLTNLLTAKIGEGFKSDAQQLSKIAQYVDDQQLQSDFLSVKQERKKILAEYIMKTLNIAVDVNSIFDVQAKRLHAYKRQLLNVMNIIDLYFKLKSDSNFKMYPRTFIFAAKAAPSYSFAKEVIKLIHSVANVVNNDPEVAKYMKVVFIPNYGVSIAEILMNAADVSEQISTAGKEASGTGNMKFMMNGAITLGTLDGANVEIAQKVGKEHIEIFGLTSEEVQHLKTENMYDVWKYYHANSSLKRVVDSLVDHHFNDEFKQIHHELMFKNDEYLLLADFASYCEAQKRIEMRYCDKQQWAKSCLVNIAESGFFSSDRTIREYAKEIWNIKPVNLKN